MDEDEFNKLFIENINESSSSFTKMDRMSVVKRQRVNLIDLKRGQNAGIALATIKMSFEEAKLCLLYLDDTAFPSEQLRSLLEYLPTQDEAKLVSDYNGDYDSLGRAEQYMTTILDILPTAAKRIQCMLFKQQFSSRVQDLRTQAAKIEKACIDVKMSWRFKKVLKTILKIGNQLNEGMSDQAGFTLDTLLKVSFTPDCHNLTQTSSQTSYNLTQTLLSFKVRKLSTRRQVSYTI